MKDVKWTARVELLSPLYIGTGTNLLEGVDWIQHGTHVYVANQETLLEAVFDRAGKQGQSDAAVAQAIAGMTLKDLVDADYLGKEDFTADASLFLYRLRGTPAMNQIGEQIKDVYGQPYLPGSSLKGALRTVLAMGGASVLKIDLTRPGRSRSWAAQPIEREIFGRDPNHDLLRALQVGDSAAVDKEALSLERVNVYPTANQQTRYGRQRGLDVDVEALRRGTVFEVPVKLEGYLFGGTAEQRLRFGKRKDWLLELPKWGRTVAGRRIAGEIEFFQRRDDGRVALGFYSRLAQTWEALKDGSFLVQVGWGAGWQSKTLGHLLQRDAGAFERMVREYRLSPQDRRRKAGQPFPKSRKLARRGDLPAQPLGWMRVDLEARV